MRIHLGRDCRDSNPRFEPGAAGCEARTLSIVLRGQPVHLPNLKFFLQYFFEGESVVFIQIFFFSFLAISCFLEARFSRLMKFRSNLKQSYFSTRGFILIKFTRVWPFFLYSPLFPLSLKFSPAYYYSFSYTKT